MTQNLRLIKFTSLALLLIGLLGCSHSSPDSMTTNDSMTLTSSGFTNSSAIPITYYYNDGSLGSDYKNYSPPLQWSGTPSSTKSLVILAWCDNDYSANWVLYMPGSSTTSLTENASATGDLPTGSVQCKNRYGTIGYAGPFPYTGDDSYEYTFAIFALDIELSVSSSSSLSDLQSVIDGHVLAAGYIGGISSNMSVTTTAFEEGGFIPVGYTENCDDYIGNANPDLTWENVPTGTESYVLIVEDQDGNANWIVYNIPAVYTTMPEGSDNARPHPAGSTFGTNYLGYEDYDGPYANGELTTYYFRIYALDTILDEQTLGPADKDTLLDAMQGHILDEAAVTGKFINLVLSSTGKNSETGYWSSDYRYMGQYSSVNPPFTWNSSGIPSNGVSVVFLGTKMQSSSSPLEDDTKTWVLYIPQTDTYGYEIPEDCSWFIHPGNWVQGATDRSVTDNWQDRGYDGFAYFEDSSGAIHTYRFGMYILASTLGIETSEIRNATYDSMITAMESATILNKAFIYGYYQNP